ncbi:MAG: hypothetical protein ABMA15_03405 [Vicinamibacterales bacterium]
MRPTSRSIADLFEGGLSTLGKAAGALTVISAVAFSIGVLAVRAKDRVLGVPASSYSPSFYAEVGARAPLDLVAQAFRADTYLVVVLGVVLIVLLRSMLVKPIAIPRRLAQIVVFGACALAAFNAADMLVSVFNTPARVPFRQTEDPVSGASMLERVTRSTRTLDALAKLLNRSSDASELDAVFSRQSSLLMVSASVSLLMLIVRRRGVSPLVSAEPTEALSDPNGVLATGPDVPGRLATVPILFAGEQVFMYVVLASQLCLFPFQYGTHRLLQPPPCVSLALIDSEKWRVIDDDFNLSGADYFGDIMERRSNKPGPTGLLLSDLQNNPGEQSIHLVQSDRARNRFLHLFPRNIVRGVTFRSRAACDDLVRVPQLASGDTR